MQPVLTKPNTRFRRKRVSEIRGVKQKLTNTFSPQGVTEIMPKQRLILKAPQVIRGNAMIRKSISPSRNESNFSPLKRQKFGPGGSPGKKLENPEHLMFLMNVKTGHASAVVRPPSPGAPSSEQYLTNPYSHTTDYYCF